MFKYVGGVKSGSGTNQSVRTGLRGFLKDSSAMLEAWCDEVDKARLNPYTISIPVTDGSEIVVLDALMTEKRDSRRIYLLSDGQLYLFDFRMRKYADNYWAKTFTDVRHNIISDPAECFIKTEGKYYIGLKKSAIQELLSKAPIQERIAKTFCPKSWESRNFDNPSINNLLAEGFAYKICDKVTDIFNPESIVPKLLINENPLEVRLSDIDIPDLQLGANYYISHDERFIFEALKLYFNRIDLNSDPSDPVFDKLLSEVFMEYYTAISLSGDVR